MIRACPHCQVPLEPGEAFLGWCGECGNCFWELPRRPAPPREGPAPEAPAPAEWRWVARGALLKLVALLMGVGAVLVVAGDADWDVRRAFATPFPAAAVVLLAAVVLDVAGRLLCLATPQGTARWLIIFSVVCQLCALPLAVGAAMAPPGASERWGLLGVAVLGQVAAAVTFTIYLFTVGVYFRSPPVITLATALKAAFAGAAAVVGVAFVVAVLLLILFLVGVLLLFFCLPLGLCAAGGAIKLGEALVGPFAVTLAVVLGLVELAYGATLGAVLWELGRRRLLGK